MAPVTTASDAELWAQTCRGEFPAFEEIVKRYQNLLCSLAYSRCGDFAVSEDLARKRSGWRGTRATRCEIPPAVCVAVRHRPQFGS